MRTALALGADRAILVETDVQAEPLGISKLLKAIVDKESPDLIILGENRPLMAITIKLGQMLGALTGFSQATFASEVNLEGDNLSVTREIDGGLQTLSINLPAIVTTDLRLNEPRYALPNIMKAKSKPLDVIPASDLGIDIAPRLETLKVSLPAEREAGVIVETVDELIDKLKNEAR